MQGDALTMDGGAERHQMSLDAEQCKTGVLVWYSRGASGDSRPWIEVIDWPDRMPDPTVWQVLQIKVQRAWGIAVDGRRGDSVEGGTEMLGGLHHDDLLRAQVD